MAGYQMELQEYSEEYMYKDGMLSNDIYSFDNASGNVIAGEARSHWATMGFYTRLNWNYNNIYFWSSADVMMVLPFCSRPPLGILPVILCRL